MVEGAGALVRKRAADNSDDDDYWGKMARCEDEACEEDMDCFCGTACVLEMMVRKRIRLPSSFSFLTLISAL